MGNFFKLFIFLLTLIYVKSHGFLKYPPSRSSLWLVKSKLPSTVTEEQKSKIVTNFNHMGLNCGGFAHQVKLGYKCGICGDPYDGVRENEAGGLYGNTGIISGHFEANGKIKIEVVITAFHKGYFQFKLCENNDPFNSITQDCLDTHLLQVYQNGRISDKYDITYGDSGSYIVVANLPDVVCKACVLQWRYHAGNSWGIDEITGLGGIGFGLQEEFYGCADISLENRNSNENNENPNPTQQYDTTTLISGDDSKSKIACNARGLYRDIPKSINMCAHGCLGWYDYCPILECKCPWHKKIDCWSKVNSLTDEWCETGCAGLIENGINCEKLNDVCQCIVENN